MELRSGTTAVSPWQVAFLLRPQVPRGNTLQPTSSLTHQYNPLGQSTHSCWPGGAYLPAGQTAGNAAKRRPQQERQVGEGDVQKSIQRH